MKIPRNYFLLNLGDSLEVTDKILDANGNLHEINAATLLTRFKVFTFVRPVTPPEGYLLMKDSELTKKGDMYCYPSNNSIWYNCNEGRFVAEYPEFSFARKIVANTIVLNRLYLDPIQINLDDFTITELCGYLNVHTLELFKHTRTGECFLVHKNKYHKEIFGEYFPKMPNDQEIKKFFESRSLSFLYQTYLNNKTPIEFKPRKEN